MTLLKIGSVLLVLVLLLAFLIIMPTLIDSTTTASAQATAVGDAGSASLIQILPLLASISGVGVSLLLIYKVVK